MITATRFRRLLTAGVALLTAMPAVALGAAGAKFTPEQVASSFKLSEVDTPPKAIEREDPVVPNHHRGERGLVQVAVLVNATGAVDAVYSQKASDDRFVEPSLAAAKAWKFEPGMKDGAAVATRFNLTFRFK